MTARRAGPARGAVILFIAAVITAIVLVAAGTAFAVYEGQQRTVTANRQWCTVLALLTRYPVPQPAGTAARPAAEAQYELYLDFVQLRRHFGCG